MKTLTYRLREPTIVQGSALPAGQLITLGADNEIPDHLVGKIDLVVPLEEPSGNNESDETQEKTSDGDER